MQMTLVHDLAECIVGDITPHCGVPVEEKHRREEEAMKEICQLLGDRGPEMLEIFQVTKQSFTRIICSILTKKFLLLSF